MACATETSALFRPFKSLDRHDAEKLAGRIWDGTPEVRKEFNTRGAFVQYAAAVATGRVPSNFATGTEKGV